MFGVLWTLIGQQFQKRKPITGTGIFICWPVVSRRDITALLKGNSILTICMYACIILCIHACIYVYNNIWKLLHEWVSIRLFHERFGIVYFPSIPSSTLSFPLQPPSKLSIPLFPFNMCTSVVSLPSSETPPWGPSWFPELYRYVK